MLAYSSDRLSARARRCCGTCLHWRHGTRGCRSLAGHDDATQEWKISISSYSFGHVGCASADEIVVC